MCFGSAFGQSSVQETPYARDSILMVIHRQIDLLKLAGGEDNLQKVDYILKTVADADTTYLPAVLEYAEFLRFRDAEKSLKYYLIYQRGSTKTINSYIDGIVRLSDAYYRLNMFDKDEELLDEALLLARDKANVDTLSEEYLSVVAQIYSQKSQLYASSQPHNYEEAIEVGLKAIDALETLSKIDSVEYMSPLAQILKITGDSYMRIKNYQEAKACLSKAVEKFAFLNADEPKTFEGKYAWAASSLASLYKLMGDSIKAIDYYKLSTEMYISAMKRDPEAYEIFYARTLHNSATVYSSKEDKLDVYIKSAKYFKKYYSKSPSYQHEYITSNKNICDVYLSMGNYDATIDHAFTFIKDVEIAAQSQPKKYKQTLGLMYFFLAKSYYMKDCKNEAKICISLALDNLSNGKQRKWCIEALNLIENQQ